MAEMRIRSRECGVAGPHNCCRLNRVFSLRRMSGATVAVLLTLVSVVGGCSDRRPPVDQQAGQDAFWGTGTGHECLGLCQPTAVFCARAELGLNPLDESRVVRGDPSELLKSLNEEAASSGHIDSSSPSDILDDFQEGPIPPVFLIHENGHMYMLVGSIQVGDTQLCQVMHGIRPIQLFPKKQLEAMDFREAWQINKCGEGVPVQVGPISVLLNKMYQNFGEVKDGELRECTFLVKNLGSEPIIVGKPLTSCVCTTTGIQSPVELATGQAKEFLVSYRATNQTSQKQTIMLPLTQKGLSENAMERAIHIPLVLFACQRQSMVVIPRVVEFGVLSPGRPCSRTLMLREVATDRFVVQDIDPGDLPVKHQIETETGEDGLAAYRVRLELEVGKEYSGQYTRNITLNTNSVVHSKLVVPVRFSVPPQVRVVPSVISLGTFSLGQSREAKLRFVSRDGERINVQPVSNPDGCAIEVASNEGSPEVTVVVKPEESGPFDGILEVRVTSDSQEWFLDIPCAGFVQDRRR